MATIDGVVDSFLMKIGIETEKEFVNRVAPVVFGSLGLSFLVVVFTVLQIIRGKGKGSLPRLVVGSVIMALSLGFMFNVLPAVLERRLNRVIPGKFPPVDPDVMKAYEELEFVTDTHADSLLWNRDLTLEANFAHVDVPRLLRGNIAIQGFTIVTGTPPNMNFDKNPAPTLTQDSITLLALAQRWPLETLRGRAGRVFHQVTKLRGFAEKSEGKLVIVENQRDLAKYEKARANLRAKYGDNIPLEHRVTAGFLGIEGLHALDGNLTNVKRFVDIGVRMMGPSHFFDNELGGSAHGVEQGGLTPFGRDCITDMIDRKVLVDLAHASTAMVDDIIEMARQVRDKRPMIMTSHTGVHEVCPSPRNLKDHHLKAIAEFDGVVCVAYFQPAVCGDGTVVGEVQSIVKSILHVMSVAGEDHVCLGSDFDGSVVTPFDTTGVVHLYEAMLAAGITKEQAEKIMGRNVQRVLRSSLPK